MRIKLISVKSILRDTVTGGRCRAKLSGCDHSRDIPDQKAGPYSTNSARIRSKVPHHWDPAGRVVDLISPVGHRLGNDGDRTIGASRPVEGLRLPTEPVHPACHNPCRRRLSSPCAGGLAHEPGGIRGPQRAGSDSEPTAHPGRCQIFRQLQQSG